MSESIKTRNSRSQINYMSETFTIDQRQMNTMSFAEIIGCILIRSQAIEQLMRQLLECHSGYSIPNDFDRKTFGDLLKELVKYYPAIKTPKHPQYPDMTLYSSLENVRDIRNDAAHGYFLAGAGVAQLLDGYGSNINIDRFILRSVKKGLMGVDLCIPEFFNFITDNNLKINLAEQETIQADQSHKN